MSKVLLEICCGSAEDVIEAAKGGADRVELNSCLFQGGLTPSVGELIVAKKNADIPIMTMIRPRVGGFHYTDIEFMTAMADAEALLAHGADGLVFGFLHEDGSLDEARCKEMLRLAGDRQKVFHRAIDVTPDWKKMLSQLIDLGFDRVLTSGQAPSAYFGRDVIRQMIEFADGRIEILPGAGINLTNIEELIPLLGATQLHMSANHQAYDTSSTHGAAIHFCGALYPPEDRYSATDRALVSALRAKS